MPTLLCRVLTQGSKGVVPLSWTVGDCFLWHHCWLRDDMALSLCYCSPVWAALLCKTRLSFSFISDLEYVPIFHFCFLEKGLGKECGFSSCFMILGKSFPLDVCFSMCDLRIVRGPGTQVVSGFASIVVTQCHCQLLAWWSRPLFSPFPV